MLCGLFLPLLFSNNLKNLKLLKFDIKKNFFSFNSSSHSAKILSVTAELASSALSTRSVCPTSYLANPLGCVISNLTHPNKTLTSPSTILFFLHSSTSWKMVPPTILSDAQTKTDRSPFFSLSLSSTPSARLDSKFKLYHKPVHFSSSH